MDNRIIHRFIAFIFLISLLMSCAYGDCNDKFLFINIDADSSSGMCGLFLFLQVGAILLNYFYRQRPGWRREKVQRNIYDKNGDRIGAYDTGEYNEWYVSEEKAEKTTATVRFWAWFARIALPRFFITMCVVSWISPRHVFWMIVMWIAIAPIWIYFRFQRGQEKGVNFLIELVYLIILIVFLIVYAG